MALIIEFVRTQEVCKINPNGTPYDSLTYSHTDNTESWQLISSS